MRIRIKNIYKLVGLFYGAHRLGEALENNGENNGDGEYVLTTPPYLGLMCGKG